jgi:hypothetical protein
MALEEEMQAPRDPDLSAFAKATSFGINSEGERERILDAYRSGVIDAEQRDRRLADLRTRWWDDGEAPHAS